MTTVGVSPAPAAGAGLLVDMPIPAPDPDTGIDPKDLSPGATIALDLTISQVGDAAQQVKSLTLSFSFPADTYLVSVSGCPIPEDVKITKVLSPFVCTVTNPFPYNASEEKFTSSVPATIIVARKSLKSSDAIPETCPAGETLGDVKVEVTSDPNLEVTYAKEPVALKKAAYAILEVEASAPASASEGDTLEVTGSVKNLGPCVAPKVKVRTECAHPKAACLNQVLELNYLTLQSGTGACEAMTADAPCELGDLDIGAKKSFSELFSVDKADLKGPKETIRASGFMAVSGVDDPGGKNVADTITVVAQSGGGCSTVGGSPGVLLGLIFAAPLLRRRTPRAS